MEQPSLKDIEEVKKDFTIANKKLSSVKNEINNLVFGQNLVINQILISILAEGHALIIGLPGLAKTRIVSFLSIILGFATKRVQFTPDLMPSDILGSEILEENAKSGKDFRFIEGPIFSQLLLADEINRASPRTQSALLQAMQEKKVTITGNTYDLPKPFHVLATQNSIDQEGTWEGYDVDLLNTISNAISIPVIANGGAGKLEHFKDAVRSGASAVAIGNMVVYQKKGMGVLVNFPCQAMLADFVY